MWWIIVIRYRFDSQVEIVESVAGEAPENEAPTYDACSDSDRRNTSDSEALAKKVRVEKAHSGEKLSRVVINGEPRGMRFAMNGLKMSIAQQWTFQCTTS